MVKDIWSHHKDGHCLSQFAVQAIAINSSDESIPI